MYIHNTISDTVEYTFFKSTYNSQLSKFFPVSLTSRHSCPCVVPPISSKAARCNQQDMEKPEYDIQGEVITTLGLFPLSSQL